MPAMFIRIQHSNRKNLNSKTLGFVIFEISFSNFQIFKFSNFYKWKNKQQVLDVVKKL